MQDTNTYRAHIMISGKVQGVGFRYHLQQTARQLNLSGWVRNRSDGRVEAVLIGSKEQVEAGIKWAQRGEPPAQVTDVAILELTPCPPTPSEFTIAPTL